METLFFIFCVIFFVLVATIGLKNIKEDPLTTENREADSDSEPPALAKQKRNLCHMLWLCFSEKFAIFWSYSEMRWMVAACGVILLASFLFPKVIKVELEHHHKGDVSLSASLSVASKYSDRLSVDIHNKSY